jgi:cytochrome c oxidase subunit 3
MQHGESSMIQWNRFLQSPSRLALCFFALSLVAVGIATLAFWVLVDNTNFQPANDKLVIPPAFYFSSVTLLLGSWTLMRAEHFVKLEKQIPFRRNLTYAVLVGTVFVSVQSYGLWCLLEAQKVSPATSDLKDAVFVFALMHGLHFVVALMFVLFVWLRAIADRYDHEYSWGVTVCTWLWHALGVIWIVIMGAFAVASVF